MYEKESGYFKSYYPTYYEMLSEFKKIDTDLMRVKLSDGRIGYFNTLSYELRFVYAPGFTYERAWHYAFKVLLNHRMNRKYMSQSELSNITGISQGSISGYLSGKKMPSTITIARLAKALGVNPSYFTDCLMDIL